MINQSLRHLLRDCPAGLSCVFHSPRNWSRAREEKARGLRGAFTLIELLVVIAIIFILASILTPAFRSAREKANFATCLNNMHQISLAAQMYLNDHDEVFPPCADYASWRGQVGNTVADLQRVLNDYIGFNNGMGTNNMTSKIWICPTAVKYGRRQAFGDDPYILSCSPLTRSWGFYDITYRWNSLTTRDGQSMTGGFEWSMRAHPQSAKSLSQPSKAALFWEMPDYLPNYGLPHHGGYSDRMNCAFVDGHIQPVKVIPGAWPEETLWWYAAYGPGQGWDGIGNDPVN